MHVKDSEYEIAPYGMVHRYVWDYGHGFTIIQVNPMVKGLFLFLALDPIVVFVIGASCLNGVMIMILLVA
jgi:hypothetical protein